MAELALTPKSQKQFVNAVRAAMAGDRLTADAATMAISSPARSPRVAGLRRQLEFAAAQRAQAAARGRAARVTTRAVHARSIARRFRPTPTRSGAATHIARIVRSYLARRHLGRGGDGRAAAAAAVAAAAAADASSTSPAPATPLLTKPATRRSGRGGRTPTLVDDGNGDLGNYGISDDDGRSCFSPPGAHFAAYGGLALAAAADEPEDDKPSGCDDDDDDESGLPKPFTRSPPSSRRSTPSRCEGRTGDSHHGGDCHNDSTHAGTSWSQTLRLVASGGRAPPAVIIRPPVIIIETNMMMMRMMMIMMK